MIKQSTTDAQAVDVLDVVDEAHALCHRHAAISTAFKALISQANGAGSAEEALEGIGAYLETAADAWMHIHEAIGTLHEAAKTHAGGAR